MRERFEQVLKKYLPLSTLPVVVEWLIDYKVSLKITKARKTKLGDYRPPFNGNGHRISINNDLNKYAFLITLVHEIAHLITWEHYKNKVSPHGREWKENFQSLMASFMASDVFPDDVHQALHSYLCNPKASSCVDLNLYKALSNYDEVDDGAVFLEQLPENSTFCLNGSKYFVKGQKLRKRFKCRELGSKRYYLVNPLARVTFVNK